MKILYLKGYKRLLSQNQQAKIESFGYRRYEALAKQNKRVSVPGIRVYNNQICSQIKTNH